MQERPDLQPDESHDQFDPGLGLKKDLEPHRYDAMVRELLSAQGNYVDLGMAYGRILARTIPGMNPTPQNLDAIRRFHERMSSLLSEQDFAIMRSGFLAEVGARLAFAELYYDVYYAKPKEDAHAKIDFWVDISAEEPVDNRAILAVQVKALPLRPEGIGWTIKPFDNAKDIEAIAKELYTVANWGYHGALAKRSLELAGPARESFIQKAFTQLAQTEQYGNTRAAIMVITTPTAEHATLNNVTGVPLRMPGEERSILANQLERDIKRYFLKSIPKGLS